MSIIEVGLGDSPMIIARRITGDPRRYRELLAANPHKSIVHVGGQPTFASLGVGESLVPPTGWLGDGSPLHGVKDQNDLKALQADLRSKRGYARVEGGKVQIDWPYHDQGWGNAAPKTHAEMLTAFGIPASAPFYPTLLSILGIDPKTPVTGGWNITITQSQGFDVGSAVGQAWNSFQQGVGTVANVASALRIPGANLMGAILTGKNPVDALKADVDNFAQAANLAKNVVSGNTAAIAQDLNSQAAKLGITLPAGAVQAAVQAAQSGKSPTEIAATALGGDYKDAWNVATNFGKVASSLPPPPGLSYQPGATAAAAAEHPLTVAVKKVSLRLGPSAPAAPAAPATTTAAPHPGPAAAAPAPLTYPPYPKTGHP